MDFAGTDELWNLHDAYTVQQAAAIVAGEDPNMVRWHLNGASWFENEHGLTGSGGINRVTTAFTAVVNAINGGTLAATIRRTAWELGWNEELSDLDNEHSFERNIELSDSDNWPTDKARYIKNRGVVFRVTPDWSLTTVSRTDLVDWLQSRGMRTGFFFPDSNPDTPGYLDPAHKRYAPKLAASVKAWMAMEDENLMRGKSPLQALENWIESRYKELKLIHPTDNEKNKTKTGDINKSAVSDAAKVANWSIGGAPKTP